MRAASSSVTATYAEDGVAKAIVASNTRTAAAAAGRIPIVVRGQTVDNDCKPFAAARTGPERSVANRIGPIEGRGRPGTARRGAFARFESR